MGSENRKTCGKRRATTCILIGSCMVSAFAAIGCGLPKTGSEEVAAVVARNQRERSRIAESYAELVQADSAATAPNVTEAQTGPDKRALPRSLRDFIQLALENNPDILAAEQVASARSEQIAQSIALPDPMLTTRTFPEPIRTAEGDNYFTLGVQQRLPIPQKLDRAGRVALEETRMAIERLNEMRFRVIADVKRAWFRLYRIDKTIQITQDNQDLLRGLIEVARGQVAVGTRSQDDVLRVLVEMSNLEAELVRLRQRRSSTTAMLNTLINRPPVRPVAVLPAIDVRDVDLRMEDVFKRAAETNPELRRLWHQIERTKHAVDLAELARWPDFTVGFEWMNMSSRDAFRPPLNPSTGRRPRVPQLSEDGSDNWGITVGLNLPIWIDKIRAGIRQARREMDAAGYAYSAARDRTYFRIEDALLRVRSEQLRARLFSGTIIPQAQQAYEVSRTAYSAGTGDFLFVIDNWRKWLTFTILYHDSVAELERSIADLEQEVGMSLPELEASL